MQEIWKDIEGFEGKYQISNLGKVKNLKTDRILKLSKDKDGYLMIGLSKDKKYQNKRVHRLVAKAFIPNLKNKPQINHIDGNKKNNQVNNLEWVTNIENMQHAKKLGLLNPHHYRDKNSKKAKIIYQIDIKTNKVINIYYGNRDVERKTGFDHSSISKCCNNRKSYKTYGGYKWQYAESGEQNE